MSEATLRQRRPTTTAEGDRAISFDSLRRFQESAAPVFVQIAGALEKVDPIIEKVSAVLQKVWALLQPYHPTDLIPALYGIFLVFFGGVYMTIVASAEAAYQFGWDKIQHSFSSLYKEWTKASAAFERDNKIDKDRDGIADVDELSAQDLAARRLMVLSKSIDPEKVSGAIEGLTVAAVAILATLRIKFAKAITLGTAIGQVLNELLSPFTTQVLQYSLPDDYEKWIPVINKYGFRYVGVSLSWILMRMITAVFAAMKGSELFITGLIGYLVKYGYVDKNMFGNGGSPIVVGLWAVIALFGTYLQISSKFSLPFPFNFLFMPLSVLEQFIVFAVGTSSE